MEKFSNLKEIGEGSFARVYSAVHSVTYCPIALKFIEKNELKTIDMRLSYFNEIKLHRSLDHPFIVHYYGKMEDQQNEMIIVEFVDGESLLSHVNATKGISEERAQMIFIQIISALKYLHHRNILHRDIKLENILIEDDVIRLIDFGLSKESVDNCFTQCGSYPYAAPELLSGAPYSSGVDIWSAGVVLYAMVAGRLPFEGKSYHETSRKVLYSSPYFSSRFSPELIDLLRKMFEKDPKKRITIDQIVNHPFITSSRFRAFLSDEFPQKYELKLLSEKPYDITTIRMLENYGIDAEKVIKSMNNGEDNEFTMCYKILRMSIIKKRILDLFDQIKFSKDDKLLVNPLNNVLSAFTSKFKYAGSALAKETIFLKPPPRQASAALPKVLGNQLRLRRREQDTFTYIIPQTIASFKET